MNQELHAVASTIAREIKAEVSQVETAIRLLDEGSTVPFIARYRKEATAGLGDIQLRQLADRLSYLRELEERKLVILNAIREQEKLTPDLEKQIKAADTKTRLEDLYLPYRSKRRTKAQLAREAGLEKLALNLLENPELDPFKEAEAFVNEALQVQNKEQALEGARHILLEKFAEDPDLVNELREYFWDVGILKAVKTEKNKKDVANKFSDYFNYSEGIKKIPSHRALALFRGRREHVLQLSLILEDTLYPEKRIADYFKLRDEKRASDAWLLENVKLAWKTKLLGKLELELLARLREAADEEAIKVFARNLRGLLLAAPAGPKTTMGLDPGIRTGVKVAVVDSTGKLLDHTVIFPFAPQNEWHQSIAELAKLAAKHQVELLSIGNGTGSRETERLISDLMKMYPDLQLTKVIVSEAGASVYSASELATAELADLDVSLRGAVSIARRLQDPLAELVKITPKSIGVGQYQHDVQQTRLAKSLDAVVEDCVNYVGVDLNTASVSLLSFVAGLNEALAKNIVAYRDEQGRFEDREQLRNVARMGEKTFQQAAGFLRIREGSNPLDASAVHPEAYPLVHKMLDTTKLSLQELMNNPEQLKKISAAQFVDAQFGLPTVSDVLKELEKPGRDPRPHFKTVQFKEGVEDINHLAQGMVLDGIVTNVTNFGAFVDIGVHQDGLVHISAMTSNFVTDPHKVLKAGDIVQVKVVEVDKERRRIGLSMRISDEKTAKAVKKQQPQKISVQKPVKKNATAPQQLKPKKEEPSVKKGAIFNTAMADALSKLKRGV